MGLEAAKQIPGVGPYVRHIPAWLPLLAGGAKSAGAGAAAEAEEAEAIAAGQGTPQTSGSRPAMDAAAQMRQKLNLTRNVEQQSQFPPAGLIYRAKPLVDSTNRAADILETKGVQESMRENLGRTGAAAESEFLKNQAAGYTSGETKGTLIDDFNARLGKPSPTSKPVEYTRTEGINLEPGELPNVKRAPRAAPTKSKSVRSVQSMDDLTALLQESVRQANLRKAAGAKR